MIETVKPDWLMAQLSEECPGAPVNSLRRALTRAAKDFAATGIVTVWFHVPTQKHVASYPLEDYVCQGMAIKSIKNVEYCGCCLPCPEECKPCPQGYQLDDLHHITLLGGYVPSRSAEEDLRIQAVLTVTNETCEIPKDMAEEFEEALTDGALYYLLKQKGKKWTDFKLATFYKDQFQGKIASAKCVVQNKHSSQTSRIKGACVL